MFKGKEDRVTAEHLQQGETCYVVGVGNSMTPILKSKQPVIVEPVTETTLLHKQDIVLCKCNSHYYLHLITAIKGKQYQISNNHGHVNGWVNRSKIYGRVIQIL